MKKKQLRVSSGKSSGTIQITQKRAPVGMIV